MTVPAELCRIIWDYVTDVPALPECMDMRWWPLWERHTMPRALGVRHLYATRDMVDAMTPWPPRLQLHRLMWWNATDIVAVHLCTFDVLVAPVVSIMHVQVDRHTWERRVHLLPWGDLIHAGGATVFQFQGSPERVGVTRTWRLHPARTRTLKIST